jgi:hypothetical protein
MPDTLPVTLPPPSPGTPPNGAQQPISSDVNEPCLAYNQMIGDWSTVRDLWGGTTQMRRAGTKHLPQEPAESTAAYQIRLQRSVLFNAFRRTVKLLAGKPFSKEVELGQDVPADVKTWCDDIDNAGRDLSTFARDWFEDALAAGISHVLVDYPPPPKDVAGQPRKLTAADDRALQRRPYWCHIEAEKLIGWKSQRVGGLDTLTQIRIRETVTEPSSEYNDREVQQVLVMYQDRWERWRLKENSENEWERVAAGPNTLGKIALVSVYTGRTGFMTAEPPMMDLAHLNLSHWRSSSDQEHILHVARVPLLFGKNLGAPVAPDGRQQGQQTVEIGPDRMIVGPDNSDLKYVEHSGAAIGAGRTSLQDIEDQMVVMGLELQIRNRPNVQTATQKVIDTKESDSELHGMARNLEAAIESAFNLTAEWAGISQKGGTASVNRDFGISSRDATEAATLLAAKQAGEISRATLYAEWQRRGVLSEAFDPKAEEDLLAAQAPQLGGQPLPLGGPDGQQLSPEVEAIIAGLPPDQASKMRAAILKGMAPGAGQ